MILSLFFVENHLRKNIFWHVQNVSLIYVCQRSTLFLRTQFYHERKANVLSPFAVLLFLEDLEKEHADGCWNVVNIEIWFIFMLYKVLFWLYISYLFMLHVLLNIYYIFICNYVSKLCDIFLFSCCLILNFCDSVFIFIICAKLL